MTTPTTPTTPTPPAPVPEGAEIPGLDLTALEAEFDRQLGEPVEGHFSASMVAGGKSNLTYRILWGDKRYVLRRPPLGDYNPRNHDVAREHRILSALAPTDVPSPRPAFLVEDEGVLGVPFYVMEMVDGRVLKAAADAPDMDVPARLDALGRAMIDGMVAIHAVEPAAVGLESLGKPDLYVTRQVDRWSNQWRDAQQRSIPALDEVGRRLHAALDTGAVNPVPDRPYLVHGDYNINNVLVAGAEEFTTTPILRAVLDWEMATLGHPLMDLGVLATYNGPLGDQVLEVEKSVASLDGFPTLDALVQDYATKSGRDVAAFPFFYVLAFYKVLILTEDVRSRFLAGTTRGEGFELMGRSVPMLGEALLEIADRSGIRGLSGS